MNAHPSPDAERLFKEWLARMGREDAESIDALYAAHPDLADALRRLHEQWVAFQPQAEDLDNVQTLFLDCSHVFGAVGPGDAREGRVLGDFRLLRCLGRGGMGEVWDAEQISLSRRVALKLLLPQRVDTRSLDYFAREARAGGRLVHPGIVQVYGTGETDGEHWIAMELVAGGCDLRRSLDRLREQDDLPDDHYGVVAGFIADLCDALTAAHEAGVIHRDLKPQNVLVGADDKPRLTDFGLARITDETALSMTGDFAGTYYYMSPEQAMSKRIGLDHRTDIFSLGVVLYEMLALVRPFDGDTSQQVTEKIIYHDPPDLRALRSRVPFELSVICRKALEKRRERRYQTAAEMAADLRRYLADEPILARPPSRLRKLELWARRHPSWSAAAGVAALAFVAIALLLVIVVRTNQSLDTERTRLAEINEQLQVKTKEAEQSRDRAEKVSDFQSRRLQAVSPQGMGHAMVSGLEAGIAAQLAATGSSEEEIAARVARFRDLISLAQPTDVGKALLDQQILVRASNQIGEEFGDDPHTEAVLRQALAEVYRHPFGLLKQALSQQERVVSLRRAALGDEHPATLGSVDLLGLLLMETGKLREAEPYIREAVEGRRNALGDEAPEAVRSIANLGMLLAKQGKASEAEMYMRKALKGYRNLLGDEHDNTLNAITNLSMTLSAQGKHSEAAAAIREILAGNYVAVVDNPGFRALLLSDLASSLLAGGEYIKAEPYVREALRDQRQAFGNDHTHTLASIGILAAVLQAQGKWEDAEPHARRVLAGRRKLLGNEHSDTLTSVGGLATLLRATGRFNEAEPLARELLEHTPEGRPEYVARKKLLDDILAKRKVPKPGAGADREQRR